MNTENQPAPKFSICLGFPVVLVAHCAFSFVLYRARVMHHASITESDALVFSAPFLLAAMAYLFLLQRPFPQPRLVGRTIALVAVALIGALLSGLLGLFVAFNTYGT